MINVRENTNGKVVKLETKCASYYDGWCYSTKGVPLYYQTDPDNHRSCPFGLDCQSTCPNYLMGRIQGIPLIRRD